jgi:rhodanese-related sulfurtransferase
MKRESGLIVALLFAVFSLPAQEVKPTGKLIAQKEVVEESVIPAADPFNVSLESALDPAIIIVDVRLPMEYRRGHIERAVSVPKRNELDIFAEKTEKSRQLYLYCTTETRSRQVAKILIEKGFTRVAVIKGGIKNWKANRLPVVKGKERAR